MVSATSSLPPPPPLHGHTYRPHICVVAVRDMTSAMTTSLTPPSSLFLDSLSTGGALWFSNLTVPDSTMLLPVLLGAINLVNVEVRTRVTVLTNIVIWRHIYL